MAIIIIVKKTRNEATDLHDTLERGRLYVTVDLMVLTVRDGELALLLSRRTNPPFEGMWALPGRFIGIGESAQDAADRLMEEMLPVRGAFCEQLYTFTDPGRDPRGRVISAAYLLIVPWGKLEPAMESGTVRMNCFGLGTDGERTVLTGWDTGEEILEGLAFDHMEIVETGLRRLRGKIDYTDIGFRFLEDARSFSLGELQAVFEAVTGEKADAGNFRRTILNRYERTGRLEQTDRTEKQGRGRPAALYRMAL